MNCAVAEVVSDGNMIVDQLDRSREEVKAIPFFQRREGTMIKRADKRQMCIEHVWPEGRLKELLVSKTSKICVHLMA